MATLLITGVATGTRAQTPLTDNDFRVDLSQGLVLSGSRITGLAGAFTALGTGVDGAAFNPASYAAREMWEHKRFAWGISSGLSLPGRFGTDDYFNSSVDAQELDIASSVLVDAGLRLQVGYGGGGAVGTFQIYEVVNAARERFNVVFNTVYAGAAFSVARESLIIGGGVRFAHFRVREQRGDTLVSLFGLSPEVGVLIRPEGRRFRIGAALHMPVSAQIAAVPTGSEMVGDRYVPRSVNLPWQANVGLAVQLGERPMNVHWVRRPDPEARARDERDGRRCARIRRQLAVESRSGVMPGPRASEGGPPNPPACAELARPIDAAFWAQEAQVRADEDERFDDRVGELSDAINLERWRAYDETPRRHIIFTGDVGVTGAVPNSIGIDAFLDQERRPRTNRPTPILAAGIEGEPWRNRLKVRAGSYLEPARNVGGNWRIHATGGFDLRLFRWAFFEDNPWDFRFSFVFDVAPQLGSRHDKYSNVGFTVGLWH